ncbi:MAG TPA: MMPL family transporter, partial [Chthoniobacterales bacterium]
MPLHRIVSRLVTQRRGVVWLAVALLAIGSIAVLVTRMKLDTEVLNLLPRGFQSVEGLKVYNRDFAQVRELTFALLSKPEDVDKLEEFAPVFAESLRAQPWCNRVLAGSPIETPEGISDLQSIAVPLLLNLEPAAFNETLGMLDPAKLRERLRRLREEIEAGSPRPQFELALDPLGVIAPALKPFATNASIQEDQPLTSPDRTLRVFITVTNQPSISAFDCQKLMDEVNAFRAKAHEGWEGGPLEILVTGRSAYVAEISRSMRHDIIVTIVGSIVLVGGVFWFGFNRWLPLIGMGFSLLLCCLVALAAGLLIFGELNMVTVGFCAILIGLGVDFAILIFGRYQQARDDGEDHLSAVDTAIKNLGRAIFFGALTTAVGFLALVLSNSAGFTQLGVLIAIGIFLAGIFMMTVFFVFLPNSSRPQKHDWIFLFVKRYVRFAVRRPGVMLAISGPVLLLLAAIAISPKPPLVFDASTESMEPKDSAASYSLHTIMDKMPTRWEPAIGIIHARDEQELHDSWQKVAARWAELREAGAIKSFSTPAALALSPARLVANRETLRGLNFGATRTALEAAVAEEGFTAETFAS